MGLCHCKILLMIRTEDTNHAPVKCESISSKQFSRHQLSERAEVESEHKQDEIECEMEKVKSELARMESERERA